MFYEAVLPRTFKFMVFVFNKNCNFEVFLEDVDVQARINMFRLETEVVKYWRLNWNGGFTE
jgi:hypothetical protein